MYNIFTIKLFILSFFLFIISNFVFAEEIITPDNATLTSISTNVPKHFTITTKDFFVKVKDQIIPIDLTAFTIEETILERTMDSTYYPTIENITSCDIDDNNNTIFTVCNLTTSLQKTTNLKRKTTLQIDNNLLKKYLKKLQIASRQMAQNVKLMADINANIIIKKKEKVGYEIAIEEILQNISKYFDKLSQTKIISLPVNLIYPEITSTNYKQIGLKEKIGSGKSNFRGSPKNRIHNIHNATSKFEGIIIAPNETFSFVSTLGDVDESTGYKEELVIKDNKTFPEFGGGICQVSTTLFRSAVNTGLKITERRNHAYPVQYYSPQGTDATVYIPKPDLQFKNNTDKYIMLQPHIEGTILTFDIFGTSDGRQVKTEGPTLLKRGDDGSRKYVWWQIVNDKNGNQISKKGFWSYYQDAAKFHGGTHDTKLTSKPKNWSGKQWKQYKRGHKM